MVARVAAVLMASMLVVGACVADDEDFRMIGIGAMLIQVETDAGRAVRIEKLIPDAPAEKAGVKAGDVVTHVDGTALAGMPLVDVVGLVRGEVGTQVVLTVTREGADAPMDITVTRGEVKFEGQDDLAAERAEGIGRVAQEQEAGGAAGQMNFTVAVGGEDGQMRVISSSGWGRGGDAQADMAVTDTHVFVLRGHMLHQFAAEGMALVWERDLRTEEELEMAEGRSWRRPGMSGSKLELMGPYLYALRGYMLHQFRVEDMEELAAMDLRSDEEKERMERLMQAMPRIQMRMQPAPEG